MNKKKNFITAVVAQIISLIYGLIVPRLVISTFGSNVNGLISSITQFLSFISLLEGGLGAVVLAELYAPIEQKDDLKIYKIMKSCRHLFAIVGFLYILFAICLSVVYPIFVLNDFNYVYVFSLSLILSLATISQYMFSITNKLFLQASQKIYVVNIVSSFTLIVNALLAVLCVWFFPEIHILKLTASIAFFIQPIIFSRFVDSKYKKLSKKPSEEYKIKNRWSGFGQNLAHFINMNTDIVVVSIFLGLVNVSIYSIYVLAINALRNLICTINNSYQSVFGKSYVEGRDKLILDFNRFNLLNSVISLVLFMTCLLLINPFVSLYTSGVEDSSLYYQPVFAIIMVVANFLYCLREPFRLVILSAGKFKETNFGSVAEAIINICLSILLVPFLGLIGIAIGTLVAVAFRMAYFLWFLKRDILLSEYKRYLSLGSRICFILFANIIFYFCFEFEIESIWLFLLYGLFITSIECFMSVIVCAGPKKAVLFMKQFFLQKK